MKYLFKLWKPKIWGLEDGTISAAGAKARRKKMVKSAPLLNRAPNWPLPKAEIILFWEKETWPDRRPGTGKERQVSGFGDRV